MRPTKKWWLGMAALASTAAPLPAQEVLWSFHQGVNETGFGSASAINADVNGDGFADVIIGVPSRNSSGRSCGAVYVYSGNDGSKLWDVTFDPTRNSYFGACVTGLKDIDGDGCDEFVGSSIVDTVVVAFSGKTGLPLLTIDPTTTAGFGAILDDAGDHDGDGKHDLIIGRKGGVAIYSSAGGNLIVDLVPTGTPFDYGASAANTGDVNGDGYDDVIVGDPAAGPFNPATCGCNNSGKVYLFSGKDGTVLYEIQGSTNAYYDTTSCTTLTTGWGWSTRWCTNVWHKPSFGISVDGAGDVDGDGFDDFVIGRPGLTNGIGATGDEGHALVYSGATGTLLLDVSLGPAWGSDLGYRVAGCGDANGDGIQDILTIDASYRSFAQGIHAYSGLNGARLYHRLTPDIPTSWRAGGDVDGDGRMDLLFPLHCYPHPGEVDVIAGSRLYVDLSTVEASHSYPLAFVLSSAQGVSGGLVLIALTQINGAPIFVPVAFGTFDSIGAFSASFYASAPAGSYGFQAFTIDANGKLLISPIGTLVLN